MGKRPTFEKNLEALEQIVEELEAETPEARPTPERVRSDVSRIGWAMWLNPC
jgi:hypothetical protein